MKDKQGMGFDTAKLDAELKQVVKDLEKIQQGLGTRYIAQMQRKSLGLAVKQMKAEIKDSKEVFRVYRNGGIYAEITPGTLRKSIGIGRSKTSNNRLFSGFWVGPRVKGSFKDPEKGGWFAHFINYGYLRDGSYRGANKGFADRAKASAIPQVLASFIPMLKAHAEKILSKHK